MENVEENEDVNNGDVTKENDLGSSLGWVLSFFQTEIQVHTDDVVLNFGKKYIYWQGVECKVWGWATTFLSNRIATEAYLLPRNSDAKRKGNWTKLTKLWKKLVDIISILFVFFLIITLHSCIEKKKRKKKEDIEF